MIWITLFAALVPLILKLLGFDFSGPRTARRQRQMNHAAALFKQGYEKLTAAGAVPEFYSDMPKSKAGILKMGDE